MKSRICRISADAGAEAWSAMPIFKFNLRPQSAKFKAPAYVYGYNGL